MNQSQFYSIFNSKQKGHWVILINAKPQLSNNTATEPTLHFMVWTGCDIRVLRKIAFTTQ